MNVDKKWLQAIIDEYGNPQLSGATLVQGGLVQHGWVFGDYFIDIELDVRRGEIRRARNGRTNNVWPIVSKKLVDEGGYEFYQVAIDKPIATIRELYF